MTRQLHTLLVTGVGAIAAAALLMTAPFRLGAADHERKFALPIACNLGENCFVQNYVDVDPGPGARDFACGGATYDGHKGTDFRVLSAAAAEGVSVVAAAGGKVLRLRDSMSDRLIRDYASRDALNAQIGNSECGNGVVIDHGGGWTTQYCHLRRGSISVSTGQTVIAGERLGEVGYSGMADFAHVHLAIRHNEDIVDPFTGRNVLQSERGAASQSDCKQQIDRHEGLWEPALHDQLAYGRHVIIDAGFAGVPPDNDALERDHRLETPSADSEALVFYARMINLRPGDRIRVKFAGPEGFRAGSTTEPLKKNRAVQFVFAGKKRTADRWPAGGYKGGVVVFRTSEGGEAAKVIAQRWMAFKLR